MGGTSCAQSVAARADQGVSGDLGSSNPRHNRQGVPSNDIPFLVTAASEQDTQALIAQLTGKFKDTQELLNKAQEKIYQAEWTKGDSGTESDRATFRTVVMQKEWEQPLL